MQIASYAIATLRRHPEVGAARVQDNLEGLRWGTDGDFGEVYVIIRILVCLLLYCCCSYRLTLSIHEVGNWHGVTFRNLGSLGIEHDRGSGCRAGTKVLLAKGSNMLLDRGTSLDRGVSRVTGPRRRIAAGMNILSDDNDEWGAY